MRQYEIALPVFQNNRVKNYEEERKKWEAIALKEAGGFTRPQLHADGVWQAPDGRVVAEPMIVYRIATQSETFDKLLRSAFELFHDQEAIYTADIGEAFIINRSSTHEPVQPIGEAA